VLHASRQSFADKAIAKRFFKRLLTSCPEVPRTIVTDQPRLSGGESRDPEVANGKYVFVETTAPENNRAENRSRQPTRERRMRGFRLPDSRLHADVPVELQLGNPRNQATSASGLTLSQVARRAFCCLAPFH
jgi:transposase-like protein